MKKAVFAGTFDPVTDGHLDLARRALRLVDSLTIAVASRPEKGVLFSQEDRVLMIREALASETRLIVEPFSGLLVDYAKTRGIGIIIRGLRFISDFEYEFQMALMNRHMSENFETVFMVPSVETTYISSSVVREVAQHGGNLNGLVHPAVAKALAKKFEK